MQIEQEKLNILMEKNSRIEEGDEDMLFYKSLLPLPHIRKISPENKLSFRGKLQEAVDKHAYKTKLQQNKNFTNISEEEIDNE